MSEIRIEKENMRIWDYVHQVPQEFQKSFNNGKFSGTDINPTWRLLKLTEMFGPAGIGWYYEVTRSEMVPIDDEIQAIVDINLYVYDNEKDQWSKPIYGTGGNMIRKKTKTGVMTTDEGFKMAVTDAISVACKSLGIGADIYMGGIDASSKYAMYMTDNDKSNAIAAANELNDLRGDISKKLSIATKAMSTEEKTKFTDAYTKIIRMKNHNKCENLNDLKALLKMIEEVIDKQKEAA